jgi:hypothetical protein
MILEDIQKEIYFQDSEVLIPTPISDLSMNSISHQDSSLTLNSGLDMSISGIMNRSRADTVRWIKSNSPYMNKFKFGNTFVMLLMKLKKNPSKNSIIFDYLRLSMKHLCRLEPSPRVNGEFSAWTEMFLKSGELLLDVDKDQMTEIIKMLPPEMVYRFIENFNKYFPIVKLNLLQHLEELGKSDIIQNKILFFTLVCKFRPEKAHNFIETLEASNYEECLKIAKKERNFYAQAYIQFKRGRYIESFNLYSKM